MTNKELKELGEYLETEKAIEEGRKLQLAVKEGKRTPESLTDKEVALCMGWCDYCVGRVLQWGKKEEKREAMKLMREALATGKQFFVGETVYEGVFESEEEMEEYMSQPQFHMSII